MSPNDHELVSRARSGDRGAFHIIVDRHARSLFASAVRLVGNVADAEDVLQETFAAAFRGLAAFREQASVKTWLTQILILQAAQHHRTRRRHQAIRLGDQDVPARGDAQAGPASDLRLDLGSALLALGQEHREVIVLRELQGMSYDEMALVLKVPRGTVESRLFRARRQLQHLLKEYLL